MKVLFSSNKIQDKSTKSYPAFTAGGKPLSLKYIVEKRSHLLPERVLVEAKKALATPSRENLSLLEIHKSVYAPLMECETLLKAQKLFPEFSEMLETVKFKRNSIYAKLFKKRFEDENFALLMLKEIWAKLKTKEEIAQELGMPHRNSLEWSLKQIGFISYKPNYKTLLMASDAEGNRVIAQKTTAWNQAHPDLMYARNKHAAQGCKTKKYRKEHAQRMLAYDIEHPERREKIGISSKMMWQLSPEVSKAMSDFAKAQSQEFRNVLSKKVKGIPLRAAEYRMIKGFYKRFWEQHPELAKILSNARKQVADSKRAK